MKILKPGNVEQRKFVCEKCGCVFVANEVDFNSGDSAVKIKCPCCWRGQRWDCGDPYEEQTPTQTDRKRLANLLANSPMGTEAATEYLLSHGVTFREG